MRDRKGGGRKGGIGEGECARNRGREKEEGWTEINEGKGMEETEEEGEKTNNYKTR